MWFSHASGKELNLSCIRGGDSMSLFFVTKRLSDRLPVRVVWLNPGVSYWTADARLTCWILQVISDDRETWVGHKQAWTATSVTNWTSMVVSYDDSWVMSTVFIHKAYCLLRLAIYNMHKTCQLARGSYAKNFSDSTHVTVIPREASAEWY